MIILLILTWGLTYPWKGGAKEKGGVEIEDWGTYVHLYWGFKKISCWAYLLLHNISGDINRFQANVPFLYPLKTSENLQFSDVFRWYRKGTLAWNSLKRVASKNSIFLSRDYWVLLICPAVALNQGKKHIRLFLMCLEEVGREFWKLFCLGDRQMTSLEEVFVLGTRGKWETVQINYKMKFILYSFQRFSQNFKIHCFWTAFYIVSHKKCIFLNMSAKPSLNN